jgi:hypothetical protein
VVAGGGLVLLTGWTWPRPHQLYHPGHHHSSGLLRDSLRLAQ